jgi:hypothetical protein
MYFIVYKITNTINEKIYIGVHQTADLNDGYMGSGKYLKRAIQKHGVSTFSKEILHIFDNKDDMYAKEAELVTEDFISETNTYNLRAGGIGGFSTHHQLQGNSAGVARIKYLMANDTDWVHWRKRGYQSGVATKKKLGQRLGHTPGMFHHSSHAIEKIRSAKQGTGVGEQNSQFGTMWIYNILTFESKKINKNDIIPPGYVKGRKIKPTD